ncbi:hypothetical protein OF83DRAFT_1079921 [Amylostereum chailletii]|nr:hypothetical protein OF83DRAFT_1079921 [Amylostereum chailletii]
MSSPAFSFASNDLSYHPSVPSAAKARVDRDLDRDQDPPTSPPFTPLSPSSTDPSLSPSVPTSTFDPGHARTPATGPVRTTKTSRSRKGPDHIPRPRNAWIIFLSEFYAEQRETIHRFERDRRHINTSVSVVWNGKTPEEKQPYILRAQADAAEHKRKYPDYLYKPAPRVKRSRKTNRSGPLDAERDRRLGELLGSGLDGDAIKAAMDDFFKDLALKRAELAPKPAKSKASKGKGKGKQPAVRQEPQAPASPSPSAPPTLYFPFYRPVPEDPSGLSPLALPSSLLSVPATPVRSCEPVYLSASPPPAWNAASVSQSWADAASPYSTSLGMEDPAAADLAQMFKNLLPGSFDSPQKPASFCSDLPQDFGFQVNDMPSWVPEQSPTYLCPDSSQGFQANEVSGWVTDQSPDVYADMSPWGNDIQEGRLMSGYDAGLFDGAASSQNVGFEHSVRDPLPPFSPILSDARLLAFGQTAEVSVDEQAHETFSLTF